MGHPPLLSARPPTESSLEFAFEYSSGSAPAVAQAHHWDLIYASVPTGTLWPPFRLAQNSGNQDSDIFIR